jgi:hypothetical protein
MRCDAEIGFAQLRNLTICGPENKTSHAELIKNNSNGEGGTAAPKFPRR